MRRIIECLRGEYMAKTLGLFVTLLFSTQVFASQFGCEMLAKFEAMTAAHERIAMENVFEVAENKLVGEPLLKDMLDGTAPIKYEVRFVTLVSDTESQGWLVTSEKTGTNRCRVVSSVFIGTN